MKIFDLLDLYTLSDVQNLYFLKILIFRSKILVIATTQGLKNGPKTLIFMYFRVFSNVRESILDEKSHEMLKFSKNNIFGHQKRY